MSRCVHCNQPVSYWIDAGWVHDDRSDGEKCWNAEGPVLR